MIYIINIILSICALALINLTAYGQQADFSAGQIVGCAPLVVNFTDQSTGNPESWLWEFGKSTNNTSSEQNPSTIYTQPGIYTVKLSISSSGNTNTAVKEAYIHVYEDPAVNFAYSQPNSCNPSTVVFQDLSFAEDGELASWNWVFGDGQISNQQHPTNIYNMAGDYDVTLSIATDYGCSSTLVQEALIHVTGIQSDFVADSPERCNVPATISFQNLSTGPGNLSFHWDFGDGTTSTVAHPSHTYLAPGSYDVTLLATNDDNCQSTFTRSNFISLSNIPSPNFTQSTLFSCPHEQVRFSDVSDQELVSRSWDFGNGEISTAKESEVVFDAVGEYLVTLKQTLEGGCVLLMQQTHTVFEQPQADFDYSYNCDGSMTFENRSQNSDGWLWDFGDGSTSQESNPVHFFKQEKTYPVSLTALNRNICLQTTTKSVHAPKRFAVKFLPDRIYASESNPGLGGCTPRTIQFIESSLVNSPLTNIEWSFGDGQFSNQRNPSHTFTEPGDYQVILQIETEAGCSGSASQQVSVTDQVPMPNFVFDKDTVCVGEAVTFTSLSENTNQLLWDFGFRNISSTANNVATGFPAAGIYNVTLIASNSGCSRSVTIENAITVVEPTPSIRVAHDCTQPFSKIFINESIGADSWAWDFGDGGKSQEYSPVHIFAEPGEYVVSLKVGNSSTSCDNVTIQERVEVVDLHVDFEVSNQALCRNAIANFTDTSVGAARLLWDFSDGSRSNARNPEKTFDKPGTYSVTLRATDVNGCSKSITEKDLITVADVEADFSIIPQSDCQEFTVDFKNESNTLEEASFRWDFGDGSSSEEISPSHIYREFGIYTPSLVVNANGGECLIIKDDLIRFTEPKAQFTSPRTRICIDEQIIVNNLSEEASFFQWSLDKDIISTGVIPKASFSTGGKYDLSLVAMNRFGCTDTTVMQNFFEVTTPKVAIEAYNNVSNCPPQLTSFSAISSADVERWLWDFGDGQTSEVKTPTNSYSKPGEYDVTLIGINDAQCADTVKRESMVKINGPTGTFSISNNKICAGDKIDFISSTEQASAFTWDFGDGIISSGSSTSHRYKQPGKVTPILILKDDNNCEVVIDQQQVIVIDPLPSADPIFSPDIVFNEEPIEFDPRNSPGVISWLWDFGDGTTSIEASPLHSYDSGGSYLAKLALTGGNGCQADFTLPVDVHQDLTKIPNVFTPNGDAYNQNFVIVGIEKSTWELVVLNRWGREVYRKSAYRNEWNGGDLPAGTYFYTLRNQFRNRTYTGFLSLIR